MISLIISQSAMAQSSPGVNQNPGAPMPRIGREVRMPLTQLPDDVAINIDGRLDEAVWSQLEPSGGMGVIEPETLVRARCDARIRVFSPMRGLYIGAFMEQPPETRVARITARDDRDVARDRVTFTLDTSGEGQFGYWVSLALGDNQLDGTIQPERMYSTQWDGAWYGATAETETGWTAEFFLPWGQVAMPYREGTRQIGIYSERLVAHLDEAWAWPTIARTDPIFLGNYPLLELDGVNPRQQWSLFPSMASTFDEIDNDWEHRAGVDLFWRPSSNFQMT